MRLILLLCLSALLIGYAIADEQPKIRFGEVLAESPGTKPVFLEQNRFAITPETLYGLVVEKPSATPFTLSTIHFIPRQDGSGEFNKVASRMVEAIGSSAVWLKPLQDDPTGIYMMEVYVDLRLVTTIEYELYKVH
ncbi:MULTISPECIES: hypothetical protein [Corallincola]|uniref:DUF4426 domain-containing protein n=2 Tax=Corallincola TaxID=1775176 RepID=A0ABY1WP69_9GAMM|nr:MULTISPECIES: hypothetical protein [Corallincola]TAA45872.1 hypothetical protein EXY25_10985 [Corallincola spongiicola]TCI03973.1 hypothetical protein EZV61_07190 [Corallincola luteus]